METLSFFDLFHFLRPWWFILLPAWLLLSYLLWKNHQQKNGWSALCDPALLSYLVGETTERTNRSKRWLTALISAGCIAIVALAGPVWKQLPQPLFQAQSAMVIVLDLSRSMDAEDLKPSRLIRAKQKVQDILAARVEGQTGLIVFAGTAFDVVPLTTDNQAILSLLASLDTSMMPSQGSMASEGLKHALSMFQRGAIHAGSVVILCDGIDQNAIPAAQALSKAGHLVSVLAVGTADGAPIPAPAQKNGSGGFLKDSTGSIVVARVDNKSLSAVANAGDGLFQHIRLDDADVRHLPGLIPPRLSESASDQSAQTDKVQTDQWHEEGPWILLLLLPLCALAFRRGALFMVLLLPMLSAVMMPTPSDAMEWKDLWQTPDQQAQTLMQQEHHKDAAQQFEDPQWKAAAQYRAGQFKESAEALEPLKRTDALYNRANALAKAGDLQAALDTYDEVLKQDSKHQDARFNHDLVEKLLKKQQSKENKSGDKGKKSDKQNQQQGNDQSKDQSQPSEQSSKQQGEQSQDQSQASDAPDKQASKDSTASKNDEQTSKEERKQEAQAANKAEEKSEQDKETQAASKATNDQKSEKEHQQARQQNQIHESDQQALEKLHEQQQLLRRIPDDPGGLLRRKFKYQYKQQGAQPLSGSNQAW